MKTAFSDAAKDFQWQLSQHKRGVFPHSPSLCVQLQPAEGTKLCLINFPVLSSPLSEVLGEATEQPGQCCRTAAARTRLAELPLWGNAFADNKDEHCCTYCCGCCIPYTRQLFLLLQWLVSVTAESLNQLPQQDTYLQPHDYFPSSKGFSPSAGSPE